MYASGTGSLVKKSEIRAVGTDRVVLDAVVVTEGKNRRVVDDEGKQGWEREKIYSNLTGWNEEARRLDKMIVGESFDFSGVWHQPDPYTNAEGKTVFPNRVVDLDSVEFNRRDGRTRGRTAEADLTQDVAEQQDAAEVGVEL